MSWDMGTLLRTPKDSGFDVICAGEARWDLAAPGALPWAGLTSLRFRPGGAAVNVALALAGRGLRVGLAAALGDDTSGRALLAKVAAAGVDVGAASLSPARPGLVLVKGTGGARQVVSYGQEEPPIAVPAGWAARVLLLTGLSPVTAHAAAFCKEARVARRAGTVVVVDVNARRHVWMGRDPRAIRAVLGEADVVRCSADDLAVLGMDAAAARAMMRQNSVLVGSGTAWVRATGAFDEIAMEPRAEAALPTAGAGDVFTAAICAELARAGAPSINRIEVWERVLQRGHAAATERRSRR
jgi:2-dehydro-3-deoxygluconokinase